MQLILVCFWSILPLSPDPLSNWCAAVALSHCLKGNPTQKEQLLRVQLATSVGEFTNSLDCSSYTDWNIRKKVGKKSVLQYFGWESHWERNFNDVAYCSLWELFSIGKFFCWSTWKNCSFNLCFFHRKSSCFIVATMYEHAFTGLYEYLNIVLKVMEVPTYSHLQQGFICNFM